MLELLLLELLLLPPLLLPPLLLPLLLLPPLLLDELDLLAPLLLDELLLALDLLVLLLLLELLPDFEPELDELFLDPLELPPDLVGMMLSFSGALNRSRAETVPKRARQVTVVTWFRSCSCLLRGCRRFRLCRRRRGRPGHPRRLSSTDRPGSRLPISAPSFFSSPAQPAPRRSGS